MPFRCEGEEMTRLHGLEDVERTAEESPDTFFIPPDAERRSQRIGDSVRLHFVLADPAEGEPRAERMWVTITESVGSGESYKGRLENQPAFIDNLMMGDEVSFEPRHIARTVIKKSDPRWIDSSELKAFVSAMCLEAEECVRFLYREEPDRAEDSGWRMFTGHESDGYANEPQNIRLIEVGWILDRDPSLLEPLKQGVGAVYERKNKGSSWVPVSADIERDRDNRPTVQGRAYRLDDHQTVIADIELDRESGSKGWSNRCRVAPDDRLGDHPQVPAVIADIEPRTSARTIFRIPGPVMRMRSRVSSAVDHRLALPSKWMTVA